MLGNGLMALLNSFGNPVSSDPPTASFSLLGSASHVQNPTGKYVKHDSGY